MRLKHKACLVFLLLAGFLGALAAGVSPEPKPVSLSYREARSILQALADKLPPGLRGVPASQLARVWRRWAPRHDAEIRGRLVQGEEDSLINFLLFGTSFTRQPRATAEDLERFVAKEGPSRQDEKGPALPLLGEALRGRIKDLARAMGAPGGDERLQFARRLVERRGHRLDTPAARRQAESFLLANLYRVLKEQKGYARAVEAARQLGNPAAEFAERSTLFQNRGLSVDTSLFINFAVERALGELKARGLLAPGSVHRVAVIGPGLDFTDKAAGYDFYPLQTIQPFALMDSLLRLGLARPRSLQVTTLDISSQVNQHLAQARQRARRGLRYKIELPVDPGVRWTQDALDYWRHFGDQIGAPAPPVPAPPILGAVKVRAVSVPPALVLRVAPADLDIVLQHLALPPGKRFDLMIATNVFVYYSVFEQDLALANVAHMLRPRGFLLSNNLLYELPFLPIRSVDYSTAVYSNRQADGDRVVWYELATH